MEGRPEATEAKLRRSSPLTDRDEEAIDRLLMHPAQVANVSRVANLITMLRECRELEDYWDFQGDLFRAVYGAQVRGGEIARAVKRQRAGKPYDQDLTSPSVELETEQLVNDRVVRQLRSVGDALAWRLFGFDRRYIMVLSQNEPVGPMPGKEGLDHELGRVVQLWQDSRHFGLLHDLTSCLRIADITEFYADGSRMMLHEVKSNPRRSDPAQKRRAEAAVATIQEGRPMAGRGGDASLVRSTVRLRTVLGPARNVLEEAANRGIAARRLPGPRALSVLDGTATRLPEPDAAGLHAIEAQRMAALEAASVNDGLHRLRANTADTVARLPAITPLGAFPFKPATCARLICDYTVMEWYLGVGVLRAALERAGLRVRVTLPRSDGELESGESVLVASKGDRAVTVHGGAVHQLLLEGLELDAYAAALTEMLDHDYPTPSAVLVFSNERSVWR